MLFSLRNMGTITFVEILGFEFLIMNHIHLFHPAAEVIQSVGVDIPKSYELAEVKVLRVYFD